MAEREDEVTQVVQARVFQCKYCDRVFTTSQALGGHQNGHRRAREVVKRAQCLAQLLANPQQYPYFDRNPYSYMYALEANHQYDDHLLPPLHKMNLNPQFYGPNSLPAHYYSAFNEERLRGGGGLSNFGVEGAIRVHEHMQYHEPPVNLSRSSTSLNLDMLFNGRSIKGGDGGGEDSARGEGRRSDHVVDLDLHL